MPKTDHEVYLVINQIGYEVFFEREWEVEREGYEKVILNDEAYRIKVNGIPLRYFVPGFADQVSEAVEKWMEANEPKEGEREYEKE